MSTETNLEQRRNALLEIVNTPSDKERAVRELAEIERQMAELRKQEALDDAKARMVAIKRTEGSLRTSYKNGVTRVAAARKELSEANTTLNDRYRELLSLAAEARALNKAFGVPLPTFASLKSQSVEVPTRALQDSPQPVALYDVPDVSRIMGEIVGTAPDVARDDALTAELYAHRQTLMPERDGANEARELKRFGTATPTPGYK